ncbi:MAG TPA: Hsp20/alpha crystallin family protein [Candidatus Lokiarchaeia archaeon]|nr:Hsp20/alpha crystallin family protein [Candidatus Lokiarchaeia archaeon]
MSDEKDVIRRIWVPGFDCDCDVEDKDKVSMKFDIPGARKEDIDLRIIPDGLRLVAKRDPTTEYVSEYSFKCPVDVDNVRVVYNEGELDIEIPMTCSDPFSDSPRIDVQ